MTDKPLNDKQQAFLSAYLSNGFNATQAAKSAGYSERTAVVKGCVLKKDPRIAAEISRYMDELAMPMGEALARLSLIATGSMEHFVDASGNIDLAKATESGVLWLLKSYSVTDGEKSTSRRIELYDKQAALVEIIKQHRLASGQPTENLGAVSFNFTTITKPDEP